MGKRNPIQFLCTCFKPGRFRFKGVDKGFKPVLVPPAYNTKGGNEVESPVTGQDLAV